MRPYRIALISLALFSGVGGCSKEGSTPVAQASKPIQVGGLYASQDKDGTWRIVKVLAVDDEAVHLRIYANKFREQPTDVDPATLKLGSLNDPSGFGIGHVPIAKEGFNGQTRILLKVVPVKEDELEGYRLYLEAMKGDGPTTR